jgi:type IV pilus assembly protein PilV
MPQYQSIATLLASELGDRMSGNVQAFEKGSYTRTAAYLSAAATAPPCKIETACTADEMAAINMAQWIGELGDAYLQRDAVNPLATDVWLLWMDPDAQFGKVGLGVGAAEGCPAAAVAGIKGDAPKPRCMYYRISI